jgi:hypothetical protein
MSDHDIHYRSASYRPCNAAGCHEDCNMDWPANLDQPCWGQVEVIDRYEDDDGGGYLHGCKGHEDTCMPGDMYRDYILEVLA